MHTRIRIAAAAIATVLALALLLTGRSSKKESERPGDEVIEQTYKVSADASVRILPTREDWSRSAARIHRRCGCTRSNRPLVPLNLRTSPWM